MDILSYGLGLWVGFPLVALLTARNSHILISRVRGIPKILEHFVGVLPKTMKKVVVSRVTWNEVCLPCDSRVAVVREALSAEDATLHRHNPYPPYAKSHTSFKINGLKT